jgi:ABC-2 type transport system permease protein
MRRDVLAAIVGREFDEIVRNRLLLFSILVPPVVLVVAPLAAGGLVQTRPLPHDIAVAVVQQRPDWAGLEPGQLSLAFTVQQFLVYFLLMPAYIPLSIATYSIIGEKQSRSLEAVLATPVRTIELLAGKSIAALVPGIAAGWATFAAFVALAWLLHGAWLATIVTDGSWLAGTFLLGPALGFVSVVAGTLVSSRVNDPRTGQQIAGFVLVPLIGFTVLQATGTVIVGALGYALTALVFLVAGLVGLRLGVGLFGRETILTRWR